MAEIDVFPLLEEIIGEKIPPSIVYILTKCGFSSKFSLQNIKSENITQIEKYFEQNYDKLNSGLINSIYENIRPFQIAPGHRILIESFPQLVDQIKTVQ